MPIGQLHIRTRIDQRLERGLVACCAITQNDGFNDSGSVQIVHMVQRCASRDQLSHHTVMAKVLRCD